jgi:hypothetical protein
MRKRQKGGGEGIRDPERHCKWVSSLRMQIGDSKAEMYLAYRRLSKLQAMFSESVFLHQLHHLNPILDTHLHKIKPRAQVRHVHRRVTRAVGA